MNTSIRFLHQLQPRSSFAVKFFPAQQRGKKHFFFYCCLCLLAAFSGQLLRAQMNEDVTATPPDEICLTGWIPVPESDQNHCLELDYCPRRKQNSSGGSLPPDIQISTCPTALRQAVESNPNIMAMAESHSGNTARTEYISPVLIRDSPTGVYGWSIANFGFSGLHVAKAVSKAIQILNGNNTCKNTSFFTTYMVGALYHILEMPVITTTHLLPHLAHCFIHTGMLFLSIMERLYDCSCCSQYKNGHNSMIAFHLLTLAAAMFW